jgi:nicotinate-nucleotide pyrophosphorylase (carboxylating)
MMMKNMLHESSLSRIIEQALFEDVGFGDIGTDAIVDDHALATAHIIIRQDAVIAGMEIAALVFRYAGAGITFSPLVRDGDYVQAGKAIAHLHGPLKGIFAGERTALNFLMRLSGIATVTRQCVDLVRDYPVKITDTRETIPTLRMLDKFAVKAGGGENRPYGLDDCVLVTSNHFIVSESVEKALRSCLSHLKKKKIQRSIFVEVTTVDTLREVLRYADRIHRIILKSFPPDIVDQAMDAVSGRVEVEVDGNVTIENIRMLASTGVNYIALGELIMGAKPPAFVLQLTP